MGKSRRFAAGAFATACLLADVPASGQSLFVDPNAPSANGGNASTQQSGTGNGSVSQQAGQTAAQAQMRGGQTEQTEIGPDYITSGQDDRAALSGTQHPDQNTPASQGQDAGTDPRSIIRRPYQPSEFEAFASRTADKPLRRFGAELLVPEARGFVTPTTTAVPPAYVLNAGDQIVIGLAGSVRASDLRLTIDAEGRVFVPQVGAVKLAGVRYGDVQTVLGAALSRQYRNATISVTTGRLHGITVYVTGFAAVPGSYTVTSLSTLVDAVLAAGGPSAGGSFRSIQLRRNGALVSDFDLYDLLLKGDTRGDAVVENGDVIYIAPAGAQAAVIGSVNHEAIYEAGPKDSLKDVLIYAGGVSTVADESRLLLLDPIAAPSAGWQELSPDQVGALPVKRGEILRVLSNLDLAQPTNQLPVLVTLSGEVAHPGRYYVKPGTSIAAVMAEAGGLTRQAYAYGVVFTRESVRLQQRTSNERALRDMESTLTAQPLVSLAARDVPDRQATVRAFVQQLRSVQPDGRLVLNTTPSAPTLPDEIVLENNDTLYVPPRPIGIGVFGSVPSPSTFVYKPGETIGDVLARAGGVKKFGDRKQLFVLRANGSVLAKSGHRSIGKVLHEPAEPGDLVYVPINALRGEFWANLRDATSGLTGPLTALATIAAVTN